MPSLASLDPIVGVNRPGDEHQPARFLGHPALQEIDRFVVGGFVGIELLPIRIEGDDRVVLRQLLHRIGEMVENLVAVLRDAGLRAVCSSTSTIVSWSRRNWLRRN